MGTRIIKVISLSILAGLFATDAVLYATRVPGQSDCLKVYTSGGYSTGTIYKYPEGYHIQHDRPDYLAIYEVGTAKGCTMYSDTITSSLWNSQACYAFKIFNKIPGSSASNTSGKTSENSETN